jgi:hypothetical protein
MENSVKDILAHANRMKVYNNQLRLLKEKYSENNIYYTQGHQFTVDLHLISHCVTLLNTEKTQNIILLDDYKLPVQIENLQQFHDEILNLYQKNLNAYLIEYQSLIIEKGAVDQ